MNTHENETTEVHAMHEVPQELLVVHNFEQIKLPEDYGIEEYDPEKWKYIQNFLQKHYLGYQEEYTLIKEQVSQFCSMNEFNRIKYSS